MEVIFKHKNDKKVTGNSEDGLTKQLLYLTRLISVYEEIAV